MSVDADSDLKVRRVDWYFDEWIAGTARLDAVERGIYVTICNMIYSQGGPIDLDGLAKLCGCHGSTFKRALNRLQTLGKIISNDSQIMVKRCAKELEKARIRLANARENGGKGGRPPKKINELEKPTGYFPEKLAGASFNLQPPTYNHQPLLEKPPQRRGTRLPTDFTVPQEWKEQGSQARLKAKLPQINLDAEADQFADYWNAKAGKDGTKLDWRRTWLTWCRNAKSTATADLPASKPNGHSMFDTGPTEPPPTLEGFEIRPGRAH